MTGRLEGRRILVVGAGTRPSDDPEAPVGNGRAIAIDAAREGATVVCADRDRDAAAETARLVADAGGRAEVVTGDVADADVCEAIVAEAVELAGGLDGLVCNVGIGAGHRLERTSPADWDRAFAVNLRSHFLLTRAAAPHLGEGAAVVYVGSVAGLKPGTQIPSYDASKAGLIGLCRHVAAELGRRGVRANVVAPGLIDTPMGRLATQGRPARGRTPVPLGRHGTAWEVAAVVSFLLSDAAGYVTGQILAVDGGLSL